MMLETEKLMIGRSDNKKNERDTKKKVQLIEVQKEKPAVFAKDVEDLTAKIMLYRHLNTKETEVQACIDVWQGLLKVMLCLKEKQIEESDKERQKYEDGYDPKEFKLSSVKKVFILAVTKTVENHKICQLFWTILAWRP